MSRPVGSGSSNEVQFSVEFVAEEGSEQIDHGIHASLSTEGQATGRNALERAKP